MNRTTFSKPLTGFTITTLLTLMGCGLSYFCVQKFLHAEKWVAHTDLVRAKLEGILSIMKDAEAGQRGYLLTGNEEFLGAYENAALDVRNTINTLKRLTLDNVAQQADLQGLTEPLNAKFSLLEQTIDHKRLGGQVSLDILLIAKSHLDRMRVIITRMESREEVLMASRLATLHGYGIVSSLSILLAFGISLVSTIYFYNRTVGDYNKRLILEEELRNQTTLIEKKIAQLKSFARQIEDGEYGIKIDIED